HVVAVRLDVLPEFGGATRHLDGVLVVAHQEEDVITLHAAVARLHVGAQLLERGADVRPAVGGVDGRCDEITCRVWHCESAPPLFLSYKEAAQRSRVRGPKPSIHDRPERLQYIPDSLPRRESMRAVMSIIPPEILEWRKRTGADQYDEMWNGVLHIMPVPNRV